MPGAGPPLSTVSAGNPFGTCVLTNHLAPALCPGGYKRRRKWKSQTFPGDPRNGATHPAGCAAGVQRPAGRHHPCRGLAVARDTPHKEAPPTLPQAPEDSRLCVRHLPVQMLQLRLT
ncbi:uncharacterized protein LOC126983277 [Eriocheir sinensis]|uniref:uncharacterized protein LOC126983277 n=1 Tax=Eriocheir sinensis TaxID=95602 RepID=UPI0021C59BF8|nr:uncharacterized protein LOC126983277 [Eriocheir sinensis]